ncbi:MAG: HD-GYP domain-containing protein [Candidatus Methylumidiphilus sp.]
MKAVPVDVVHYEIVKLRVGDLRKGMFVCELDRPWTETPFMFEGFEIETDADVEALKLYCEHVFIDLGRTQAVRVKIDKLPANTLFQSKHPVSLEKEMAAADATRQETSSLVKSFQDEIRFGNSVDVQLAKSAVSQCVASILRNPDAMLLMAQMKEKSPHTSEHAFSVCIYSILLGRLCGLEAKQLEELGTCGLLHDIGNIEIPERILNKTTALTPEEFEVVKRHTTYGRDILMTARNIYTGAVDVAYGHHECPDGSGYPRGLTEQQINQNCQIVSVVDKYTAITRNTAYRSAHNHLDAVNILSMLADNNKINKPLCASFISYLGFYPPGTIVELSSGEVAIVLKSNVKNRMRPQVLVVMDADKHPAQQVVDLATAAVDAKGKPYKIKMVHLPGYLGIDLNKHQSALINAYE